MEDNELEKLYQAKGKQTEDINRIKKLVAVKEHIEPPKTMFGFGAAKCPKCDSPLRKKKIDLSNETITYLSCSSLTCKYEYASGIKKSRSIFS